MRLGLITDIHSHPAELARALALFRDRQVDQVVTIGDTIDAFSRSTGVEEVAELLLAADAIGVWGNHDFSLRGDVPESTQTRFPKAALTFMARMLPRLVIEHCHFSHRESSVDPHDVSQLWDLNDGQPDLVERARQGFLGASQQLQFVGHYHRWWAATSSGEIVWQGDGILKFEPAERYFVVVGAAREGWCGILDLEQATLEPLWCGTVSPG